MVLNLLETGTPFDYSKENFNKFIMKILKKKKKKKDILSADVPAIEVGEQDIPDRDNRYIDKTFEDEE